MYIEKVRIYTNDLQDCDTETYWKAIQKRLIFANNKHNMYDDFYLELLIGEMKEYSYFTSEVKINGEWYLIYIEESTCKEVNIDNVLQFTKEDLNNYYTETNNIDFTYLER